MSQIPVIFLAFANERHEGRFLDKLPVEQALLREALEPAVEAGLCEVVIMPNATVEDILDTFQRSRYKDRIAIFHYAGHADGYQLLLETRDGRNITAHGSGIVSFFGKQTSLKLIFLNGCSTQQQAEEMIDVGIPAVVGTATSIADDVALSLAVRFYKSLGQGAPIGRAWREAEDEVKMRKGGTTNFRSLYWSEAVEIPSHFPWTLYIREGAEIVNDWNLPDSVGNPLFGLPEVPRTHALPDEPYIFLRRFERKHAEVFFGRSYYIRDLYNRVTDPKAAPVILLYGQSGVGKSSLFDAGINPRLENTHLVRYVRRDANRGLLGSLEDALAEDERVVAPESVEAAVLEEKAATETLVASIRAFAQQFTPEVSAELVKAADRINQKQKATQAYDFAADSEDDHPLATRWKQIERAAQKPLVIILDQVEELYTRSNPALPNELTQFLDALKAIFNPAGLPPSGRILMGYRKEYYAEIEEAFKHFEMPRSKIFLEHLTKKDIIEVVQGLASTPRLRERYNIVVEAGLAEIIADDMLEDKDSPVAPVLQILLTKMWQLAVAAKGNASMRQNTDAIHFTINDYQQLKRDGILMDDFFRQQTEELKRWNPELVESGLALDVMMRHTTRLGTADTRNVEDLRQLYNHRQEALEALLHKMNDLYLLQGAGSWATGLAHDTLAPIVQNEFRTADFPGQRAARIIENKILNFDETNANDTCLDEADLEIVEKGYLGMRVLTLHEQKLLEASRTRRDKAIAFRRRLKIAGVVAVSLIIGALGIALWQFGVAKVKEQEAIAEKVKADFQRHKADSTAIIAVKNGEEAKRQAVIAEKNAEEAKKQSAIAVENERLAKEEEIKAQKAKKEALAQKGIAEEKKREAIEAADRAEKNRIEAEAQTKKAKIQEAKAIAAKAEAESRQFLAMAKDLAVRSDLLDDAEENELLRKKLALAAYRFHHENNGRQYDADIYRALNSATNDIQGGNRYLSVGTKATDILQHVAFTENTQLLTVNAGGIMQSWNTEQPKPTPTDIMTLPERMRVFRYTTTTQQAVGIGEVSNGIYVSKPYVPASFVKVASGFANIIDATFLPNSNVIVTISDDSVVSLWSPQGMKYTQAHPQKLQFRPNALCVSTSGEYIYVGGRKSSRGAIIRFKSAGISGLTQEAVLTPDLSPITAIAVSPDGASVAVGCNDGSVAVFSPTSGQGLSSLQHRKGTIVYQIQFDATGNRLISGGTDRQVLLRDLENFAASPIILAKTRDWCRWLSISPNHLLVAADGNDKGLCISTTEMTELVRPLQLKAKEYTFTPDEWKVYLGDIPYGKTKASGE